MPTDIAWATGLFEGEGNIFLYRNSRSVKLQMSQTDYDILLKLQSIFGGSIYDCPPNKQHPQAKRVWIWVLGRSEEVKKILVSMLPMLGQRRAAKALDALDHLEC